MSSGMSNVGASGTYEAGDQRNEKNSVLNSQAEANRFHEGKENSHKANDSSTFQLRRTSSTRRTID